MSFQDVGRGEGSKRSRGGGPQHGFGSISNVGSGEKHMNGEWKNSTGSGGGVGDDTEFEPIRDAILQYQQNVGILETISKQIGTKADGPVVQTRYKVQVDVIKQLSQKIERLLSDSETILRGLTRTKAASHRSTHVKLVRDYRRVEASFKNLQLNVRRKRTNAQQTREAEMEAEAAVSGGIEGPQHRLDDDALAREIMKEREEEILNINRGMQQVNQIYKDLAHIVGEQQTDIDNIETQMEESNTLAQSGLNHVIKANESQAKQCVIS